MIVQDRFDTYLENFNNIVKTTIRWSKEMDRDNIGVAQIIRNMIGHSDFLLIFNSAVKFPGYGMHVKRPGSQQWYVLHKTDIKRIREILNLDETEILVQCCNEDDYLLLKTVFA